MFLETDISRAESLNQFNLIYEANQLTHLKESAQNDSFSNQTNLGI